MKVFISWSGEVSHQVALALKEWIPCVVPMIEPFVSSEDIRKGNRWAIEIGKELNDSNFGIICLTSDNLDAPWVLFEAGALSKQLTESRVCTLLLGDLQPGDITGPLTIFQHTTFEKDDFRKLIRSMNEVLADQRQSENIVGKVFEKWWGEIEQQVKQIISRKPAQTLPTKRTEKEMLSEILELTRTIAKTGQSSSRRSAMSAEIERFQSTASLTLEMLELDQPIISILTTANVRTLGQLALKTPNELRELKGMTEDMISQISARVAQWGFMLGSSWNDNMAMFLHLASRRIRESGGAEAKFEFSKP